MTDISDLNKKVSNRGATAAGILTSDDVNRMVSATIELQQASQVSGDAPAGSIGEKVYTIEQQLEDVPTAQDFAGLAGGFEAEFSIDNGFLYLNLNNGTDGFHCSPAILDLSELQSALGDLTSAE